MRCTVKGLPPANDERAPAPTDERLSDGQHADHWVLCEEERARGYVRPVRRSYVHAGRPPPEYPLRDLTAEEAERYADYGYAKFETYPEAADPATGRYWTQDELDQAGKGCGGVTSMPAACAETYARDPSWYGSTFCCHCGGYFPVGPHGEFLWEGTGERVGT